MGQRLSVEKLTARIEDMIWNENFEINETMVYMQLNGLYITSENMYTVLSNIDTKEKEQYRKSLQFLKNNCLAMSDFHNKMSVRHQKMKSCLRHLFIEAS